MTLAHLATILSVSSVSILLGLLFIDRSTQRKPVAESYLEPGIALLFSKTELVHCTPGAERWIGVDGDLGDWSAFRSAMHARFPNFPTEPPGSGSADCEVRTGSETDDAMIRITSFGEHTRVELIENQSEIKHQTHEFRSLKIEYNRLDRICHTAPYPMWHSNRHGDISWCNEAFRQLASDVGIEPEEVSAASLLDIGHAVDAPKRARASVNLANSGTTSWFDVSVTPVDGGVIHHAVNIDAVIQAEIAQRNFVQTLAKTFAQLSIGLAIFDRNRQLALFNPALVDLSGLPAEFLSTRPDVLSFFDRLRDKRAMPEPKNYQTWRQEIAGLISAARDGTYTETWELESGQIYRVSGRPHPDGAIAFLIEDISAEVSLKRNFRAEIEMGQSLLDTLESGLAVFSSSGALSFCNQAYREMWKMDPDKTFVNVTITDSMRIWSSDCEPSPTWGDIRDYVMKIGERTTWNATVQHKSGAEISLTLSPLTTGATAVRFDPVLTMADAKVHSHSE